MRRRLRRHVVRAALAGLATAIPLVPYLLAPLWRPWHSPALLGWLASVAEWTLFPAIFILAFFRVHGGPEGFPDFRATIALTFILWWVTFDWGPLWWRWLSDLERKETGQKGTG